MRVRRTHSRGYALPAVMFFLVFAFGMWAVLFRSASSIIRVEKARVHRDVRSVFTAPAVAQGLRLLQTGNPPTDPYACKLTLTDGDQTKYMLLTFEKVSASRWTLDAIPTDALDPTPDAPSTFFTVPAAPSTLVAATVSNAQIDLTWDDVPFDNGYKIERSPDGSSGWVEIGVNAKNDTTYSSTGLTANTTYYYRVRGTNAAGDGAYSPVASDTTQNVPPFDPTGLDAITVATTQIDLVWTDNSTGETGFKIERSPDGSSNWVEIATVAGDVTAYSDTGLTALTTYFYRVRAWNAVGDSGYSNIDGDTTFPVAPDAPTGLAANAPSQTQVDLTWVDNANNETGFKIERSLDGSTGWTEIATPAADAGSYSDTGLDPATTYYYRVRAYNTGGNSSYSNTSSTVTLPDPPAAPTGLTASAASSSQLDLTWTDNADNETGFKIERSDDGLTGWTEIIIVSSNIVSYSDTGLTSDTTYYYRVRACNTGGNSPFTDVENGTTLPDVPSDPSGLTAVATSNTQINLSWTDNASNETGFKIERSPNGSTGWTLIATNSTDDTTYSNTGLSSSTTYHYRVRATNTGGDSANTSTTSATTTNGLPPAPSDLFAAAASTSQIDVVWTDNSTNETGFRLYRSPNGTSSWTLIATLAANVNSYSNTGLPQSTKYYYRVRSYNASGSSAYSNIDNATTEMGIPLAPATCTATALNSSQIRVNWTCSANDETGFKIERSPNGSTGWTEIGTAAANATSYTNSGLSAATQYWFRVRSYNGVGDSSYGPTATTSTTNTPAVPTNPAATVLGPTSIRVSWTDNSNNETGFRVQRSLNGSTGWTTVHTSAANATSWDNTGLTTGQIYYYRIRANGASASSAYTAIVNATP